MNRHRPSGRIESLAEVNCGWLARHRPPTENPMDTYEKDKVVPITRGRRPRMQIIFTPGPNSIEFQLQPVPNASRHAPRRPAPQPTAIRGKLLHFRTAARKGNENRKGHDYMNSFRIDENNRIETISDLNDSDAAVFSSFEDLEQL